ncbi:uncharacterized protein LOC129615126 [Condylostylus longicornis]|uniref:uncharacterized protein LOC129615126 n=1 Tax=Condylostylus longicornis TaxID=2530218 RepID=UPI00244E311A|nr:uncharacterized protein LOC129615126 [Condylostylus longicornis]
MIRSGKLFGSLISLQYVIEFQKRGLPRAHIAFRVAGGGPINSCDIDAFVRATIPSEKEAGGRLRELVRQHMVHGSCGMDYLGYPCMDKKKKIFNNQWIVPYCPSVLFLMNCHCNLEIATTTKVIKYVYKYLHKGPDHALPSVIENMNSQDETENYVNYRYISSSEALWRIFEYNLCHCHPAVVPLPIHLENEQCVIFRAGEESDAAKAAKIHGFLNNINEYKEALEEARNFKMAPQLRELFTIIILNGGPARVLWDEFKTYLSEDFSLGLTPDLANNKVLSEISRMLRCHGSSLQKMGLSEIIDDSSELGRERLRWSPKLRSTGKIVLPTATTGIAAINHEGGITAHSMFKLPLNIQDDAITWNVTVSSERAELINEADLIILDEAPMAHKNLVQCINLGLQDITLKKISFGGKIILLAGDFRQIPPIVPGASPKEIISLSLRSSALWQNFSILTLLHSMRAVHDAEFSAFIRRLEEERFLSVKQNDGLDLVKTSKHSI